MAGFAAPRALRADAKRNYDRILTAAELAFSRHGADASLEEIARQAGVGSATLHRRFPSRRALLEAVFHDRIETLCAQGRALEQKAEPGTALVTWLRALTTYASTTRGLAAALSPDVLAHHTSGGGGCHAMIEEACTRLLRRAHRTGAVRCEVTTHDLLTLVIALSLVSERAAGSEQAVRLLDIALRGITQI